MQGTLRDDPEIEADCVTPALTDIPSDWTLTGATSPTDRGQGDGFTYALTTPAEATEYEFLRVVISTQIERKGYHQWEQIPGGATIRFHRLC